MKRIFLPLLLGISVLAGALAWLAGTEAGLRSALALAVATSGGRLTVDAATGKVTGPLTARRMTWVDSDLSLDVRELRLDWSPLQLLQHRRLLIDTLDVHALVVTVRSEDTSTPPPLDLSLPMPVEMPHLGIANLTLNDEFIARDLRASFASDGIEHVVSGVHLEMDQIGVDGKLRLNGLPPFGLAASATATTRIEQNPVALRFEVDGTLERMHAQMNGVAGIDGDAAATVRPFADQKLAEARADLRGINPALWWSGAPQGDMDIRLALTPHDNDFSGSFSLINHRPGPIDSGMLPLARGSARLSGTMRSGVVEALDVGLAGKGAVSGTGRWDSGQLSLSLVAKNLDAAALVSTLRTTRLEGEIAATLGAERQQLALNLSGNQLTLTGNASYTADVIAVPELLLASGDSRLSMQGEMRLGAMREFSAKGALEHFNPARFSRWPEADINAHFSGVGQMNPVLSMQAKLELTPSHFAGLALSGRGEVKMAWPQIQHADIALTHGPNSLGVIGGFGKPGDALNLTIVAPNLASYGIQGEANGNVVVRGSLEQLALNGHLVVPKLRVPQVLNLDGATLDLALGPEPDAPLNVSLAMGRLGVPGQTASVRDLALQITGTNRQHQVQVAAVLSEQFGVGLSAEGGLHGAPNLRDWRGAITQMRVGSQIHGVDAYLTAPAALTMNPDGWKAGPAAWRSSVIDGEITLQAAADAQRATLRLAGQSAGSGSIDGQLSAGMKSPWVVAGSLPWEASLKSAIGDLSWLGGLLGEGWKTQGRLQGEVHLAGSPDRPLVNGQWRGDGLGLTIPAQGVELVRGELVMDIADNRLRVSALGIDSLLRTAPRALRLHSHDDLVLLTAKPGRLEVSGELQIDQHGHDQATLAVRMDRFGAWQRDDQWMLISGNGQLDWRAGANDEELGGELGVRGQLRADAGYWQLATGNAPRLGDDVMVKRPGKDAVTKTVRPIMTLDVLADLGTRFLFRGAGLESRLEGDIRVSAQGRDLPRASGRIKSVDGKFQAYGQKLAIERGFLTFDGLPDNPALDIRAVRKGLAVEPGVQITGTVQRPVVKLVSDPELPDPEKLSWLVLGHGPENMSMGDATTLLTAASGLVGSDSGNLLSQLKQTIGIDELGLRQGELGGVGGRTATTRVAGSSVKAPESTGEQIFTIGKRLSSDVMLSYEQSMGTAESVVKLTMNLGRQLSLIGRAGSDNALDLYYTLTFGQPPASAPAP